MHSYESEKQHLKALNTEKELARRDELTGVKNKTAYKELEKSVQSNIDNGMDYLPFGLVVCDTNDLKRINDTKGHAAGDEYLKKCTKTSRILRNKKSGRYLLVLTSPCISNYLRIFLRKS